MRKNKATVKNELRAVLLEWKSALDRFELAGVDEAGYAALELEAAKRRYIAKLRKAMNAANEAGETGEMEESL